MTAGVRHGMTQPIGLRRPAAARNLPRGRGSSSGIISAAKAVPIVATQISASWTLTIGTGSTRNSASPTCWAESVCNGFYRRLKNVMCDAPTVTASKHGVRTRGRSSEVERQASNLGVVGSIPTVRSNMRVSSSGRASVSKTEDRGSIPRTCANPPIDHGLNRPAFNRQNRVRVPVGGPIFRVTLLVRRLAFDSSEPGSKPGPGTILHLRR